VETYIENIRSIIGSLSISETDRYQINLNLDLLRNDINLFKADASARLKKANNKLQQLINDQEL
jgi:hypothetical protein